MDGSVFSDEQVTRACNLHIDNLRRLITWGAVKPLRGGGGRGRLRQWSARQALRISVTAQFVEAGFSLQMAHTLTYCLPLDDLLYAYDPDVIRSLRTNKREAGLVRAKAMISARGKNYWPDKRALGSEVLIVDREFIYSDVLGDAPTLFAAIDIGRQRVCPNYDPYRFVYGAGMVEGFHLPKIVDAQTISRSSLLIDDEFLGGDWRTNVRLIQEKIPKELTTQILSISDLICRNLTIINLAVGLTACVRKLLGLPVHYIPREEEYDEV